MKKYITILIILFVSFSLQVSGMFKRSKKKSKKKPTISYPKTGFEDVQKKQQERIQKVRKRVDDKITEFKKSFEEDVKTGFYKKKDYYPGLIEMLKADIKILKKNLPDLMMRIDEEPSYKELVQEYQERIKYTQQKLKELGKEAKIAKLRKKGRKMKQRDTAERVEFLRKITEERKGPFKPVIIRTQEREKIVVPGKGLLQ